MTKRCDFWGLRIDTASRPKEEEEVDESVRLGNIYINNQGNYQLVVGQRGYTIFYHTYDRDGAMLSLGRYSEKVFERRKLVGRASMPVSMQTEWIA